MFDHMELHACFTVPLKVTLFHTSCTPLIKLHTFNQVHDDLRALGPLLYRTNSNCDKTLGLVGG